MEANVKSILVSPLLARISPNKPSGGRTLNIFLKNIDIITKPVVLFGPAYYLSVKIIINDNPH
jgi:hypothetical protein